MSSNRPMVTGFYHGDTNSIAYVTPATRRRAIIDPVLDFDRACRGTHTSFADRMVALAREQGLTVEWALDTHPHAGHFSGGRESTVAEQRARNIHLRNGVAEEAFVQARDRTLSFPALLLDALQADVQGERLPEPEANGAAYLKIPLNQFRETGRTAVRAARE